MSSAIGESQVSEHPRDHPQSLVQNGEWNIFSAALDWYSEQLGAAPLIGAMDHLAWAAEAVRKLQAEVERLQTVADRYEHALKEIDAGVADGGWICREIANALMETAVGGDDGR